MSDIRGRGRGRGRSRGRAQQQTPKPKMKQREEEDVKPGGLAKHKEPQKIGPPASEVLKEKPVEKNEAEQKKHKPNDVDKASSTMKPDKQPQTSGNTKPPAAHSSVTSDTSHQPPTRQSSQESERKGRNKKRKQKSAKDDTLASGGDDASVPRHKTGYASGASNTAPTKTTTKPKTPEPALMPTPPPSVGGSPPSSSERPKISPSDTGHTHGVITPPRSLENSPSNPQKRNPPFGKLFC